MEEARASTNHLTELVRQLLHNHEDMARRLRSHSSLREASIRESAGALGQQDASIVSNASDREYIDKRQGMETRSSSATDCGQFGDDDTDTITPKRHGKQGNCDLIGPSTMPFGFAFEKILQSSRVYSRTAQRQGLLSSTRSSTIDSIGWSYFSSITLSDISNVSVYGLLIEPAEIYNLKCYTSEEIIRAGTQFQSGRRQDPHADIKICLLGKITMCQGLSSRILLDILS